MTEKEISLWKKQRTMTTVNVDKEIAKMSLLLESDSDDASLSVSKNKLKAYQTKIEQFNESLLPHISEAELDDFLQQSEDLSEKLMDTILKAEYRLELSMEQRLNNSMPPQSPSSQSSGKSDNYSKLPKLVIHKFSGDALKWREFWDSFNVAVHSKENLSSVEKFQYLKSFLAGDALNTLNGYPLSADTYETALEALKERYDNPEFSIFAHLDAMISMKESGKSVEELQRVFDECEAHIRNLVALGLSEDTFSRVFTPLVLSKVPRFIRIELHRRNAGIPWSLSNLRRYLKEEIAARQLGGYALNNSQSTDGNDKESKSKDKHSNWSKKPKSDASLVATDQNTSNNATPKYPCVFCNEMGHFPTECSQYTTAEARKAVLKKDRCLLCLRKGHQPKSCRTKATKCRHCGGERSHHRSMCDQKYAASKNEVGLNVYAKECLPEKSTASCLAVNVGNAQKKVVLPTAVATIEGSKGQLKVRVIFDTASTRTFARADVLKRIGAKFTGEEVLGLAGVQAESRKQSKFSCYETTVVTATGERIPLAVTALKTISCPVDKHAICVSEYPVLAKLPLADPLVSDTTEVQLDVMIGLDNFYRFVSNEQIRLDTNLVVMGTKLGYVLAGCTSSVSTTAAKRDSPTVLIAISDANPGELISGLERLWRLEDVGVKECKVDDSDAKAEKAFLNSIRYDSENQRYSVGWPWKSDEPELPENFGLAYGRLKGLLSRLDQKTLETYNRTIQDQLEKSVIEPSPEVPDGKLVHYLPHHCIIRPDKATTKLRVVYDASSKANKTVMSLNDCLYRGPVLLADLCGLLLRFRKHYIGIVSDIEKAFLQVMLQKQDRDVTRFLWVKDITKPPYGNNLVSYRFNRVLFGTKSSPYMLSGTVKHHLMKNDSDTSKDILDNCYVDNVFHGVESSEAALTYYKEAKSVFKEAGMNLREWQSNDPVFMSSIPEKDIGSHEVASVLGLKWHLNKDSLAFSVNFEPSLMCTTKRQMLKAVASIFDPLGLLSPVTISGKILLQKLWDCDLDWDSKVPDVMQQQWDTVFTELLAIRHVTVPRTIDYGTEKHLQLHCFCDASKSAYSAAVYLRCSGSESTKCHLLFAKAKVTPIKSQKLTIPRLELTALELGCRVLTFVQKEMRLNCELIAWTDSQCSLHWVNKNPRAPIYVKNRVTLIRNYSSILLRYVPTESNPADLLPTRGMKTALMSSSKLWWNGPEWLHGPPEDWPAMPELPDCTPETDAVTSVLVAVNAKIELLNMQKYSSLKKVLRVTAWIRRFLHNAKMQNKISGELSASEISNAEAILLNIAQSQFVVDNPEQFKDYKQQLGLFYDTNGLLRCSGRLDNAELPYETRFPIFLPLKMTITELIVKDCHDNIAHDGVQHVLASIREKFWLPRGRSEIRRILRECKLCKLLKGGPFKTPNPPPLPAFRSEEKACFTSVGLDYLGPILIRSPNAGPLKIWICLFTCCNTRAIHLEVVEDMTSEQFLLCLRRFSAAYGAPSLIVCDNAKQFHSAKKTTDRLWKEATDTPDVQSFCSHRGITWKFIVEFAPWFGGFYERMVGLVKKALRCVLHNQLVTLTELQTICAEIGNTVNSRPLTYCEDDVGSRTLCPNDFISRSRRQFPTVASAEQCEDPDYKPDSGTELRLKWKRLDNRLKAFWEHWRKQYLVSLRERIWKPGNRGSAQEHVSIGAVVLIKAENLPRSRWLMGRVIQVIESADEVVRSAKVKLGTGKIVHRPLKLLYPLELPERSLGLNTGSTQEQTAERATLRPKRLAAIQARKNWLEIADDSDENDISN